ncbi:diaminopimelate epimerase [Calditrichota bacterium]
MLEFDKYHGLGNDFVLFDTSIYEIRLHEPVVVSKLCDRRFGIGADGILYFGVKDRDDSDQLPLLSMIYLNSDGSRAETCFNGLRCIGLHAVRKGIVKSGQPFSILTDAGTVHMRFDGESNEATMTLDTAPSLAASKIGLNSDKDVLKLALTSKGMHFHGSAISTGNPHFIILREGATMGDLIHLADEFGSDIENNSLFALSTNVEFATINPDNLIDLAVWERGSGRTLACGSGATATAILAAISDQVDIDKDIEVRQAGGSLFITAKAFRKGGNVILDSPIQVRGKSTHVYHGIIENLSYYKI